jgi:pyruvate formate lyase activating enzyme
MKISSLQKTSLIEYPGKLSCIVFTQGCNFRCPYCHNPELVLPEKFLPLMDKGEIFHFLEKRKAYLDAVVITGGEPCIHEGLADFAGEVKKAGYLVKLETNGAFPGAIKKLIDKKLIDCVAMDVKAPADKYELLAGVRTDTKRIEESIEIIIKSGIDYEFKTTVVFPLLGKEDFTAIGEMVKGARIHYLQHFVPSAVIDEKCLSCTTGSEEDFEELRQAMLKHVRECYVR